MMSASLELTDQCGRIDVTERGPPDEKGNRCRITLRNQWIENDISLSVSPYCNDDNDNEEKPNGCQIELEVWSAPQADEDEKKGQEEKKAEEKREVYCCMDVVLDAKRLRILHGFLGFLIEHYFDVS
jgi:hypothetical protein